MEKYKTEINGNEIFINIRIIKDSEKPNFKAIVNLNFGWFEVLGFKLTYFDGFLKNGSQIKQRRDDCLTVDPPKYGFKYAEAFRTSIADSDPEQRDIKRKKLWYQLQDEMINAYHECLEKENQTPNTDEEMNLDDINF